jgi:hypothetical protein
VKSVSANSASSEAKAGANGAKAEEEEKAEEEPEPAAEEKEEKDGDATKSINKVLEAGSKVAGGEDKCPTETPQKPETSEGQVSVGAALGIAITKGTTEAKIGKSITASEAVELVTATEKDLEVIADASATNSTTGVGVAIGILVASSNNKVELAADAIITAGSFKIASIMPEAEAEEETESEETEEEVEEAAEGEEEESEGEEAEAEEAETLGNGINDIAVKTTSGAGASNVGVAGSLAINVVNMSYVAEIPTEVTADDSVEVIAEGKNKIETVAGASTACFLIVFFPISITNSPLSVIPWMVAWIRTKQATRRLWKVLSAGDTG